MKTLIKSDVSTLSIKVTELIEYKNLQKFLKTSIENSSLAVSKNTYYYFYYHIDTFTYEIIVFEKDSTDTIIEPFLLLENYYKNDDITKVIVTNSYFLVILNEKILVLKNMKTLDKDEICLYIEQMYKIKSFELIETTQELIDSLGTMKNNSIIPDIYPVYPQKSFYYFVLFTFVSIVLLFGLISFEYMQESFEVNTQTSPRITKTSTKDNKSINKALELFTYLHSSNIFIDKIAYRNRRVKTILYHPKKSKLLEFINKYKSSINLKSLKYNETKKLYALEIAIVY